MLGRALGVPASATRPLRSGAASAGAEGASPTARGAFVRLLCRDQKPQVAPAPQPPPPPVLHLSRPPLAADPRGSCALRQPLLRWLWILLTFPFVLSSSAGGRRMAGDLWAVPELLCSHTSPWAAGVLPGSLGGLGGSRARQRSGAAVGVWWQV